MKGLLRLLLTGATVICTPAHLGAETPSAEYRLKAAFVYRFPQFVEWPSGAMESAQTLDVCVLQPNPFGSDLHHLAEGESLNGRPYRVRHIAGVDAASGCHVLFAGAQSVATGVLKKLAHRPVLTIGESQEFLDDGGIIVLKVVERRVRFEVSAANAKRAGLRISAQLLSLAAAVREGAQ